MIFFLVVGLLLLFNAFGAAMNAGWLGHGSGWVRAYQCKHCSSVATHWSHVRPCRTCGENSEEVEAQITAKLIWKGKWYNPFSWYNFAWRIWRIKETSK